MVIVVHDFLKALDLLVNSYPDCLVAYSKHVSLDKDQVRTCPSVYNCFLAREMGVVAVAACHELLAHTMPTRANTVI